MTVPIIEIGETGEVGIFIGGLMIGLGVAVRVTKWVKEMVGARNGTANKYKPISHGTNGRRYLTADEHKHLCELAGKATKDVLKSIQEDMRDSSQARVQEVQRLFDKLDANHEELKDRIGQQGERIASLEAKVEMKMYGN